MKRTGREINDMLKALKADYRRTGHLLHPTKANKKDCFKRIFRNILILLWGNISAPFIYPVWYVFRNSITRKIHINTSWQEIQMLIETNQIQAVKSKLKANGKFLYWIWTYGDCDDPLGSGGMPDEYGKNNFWNRFRWSAIRNPRFNINYTLMRTASICQVNSVRNTLNPKIRHCSFGIGCQDDGIIFKWMKDIEGEWYFIYEEANFNAIWYFGWVGLIKQGDIGRNGRFELSYRVTEETKFV